MDKAKSVLETSSQILVPPSLQPALPPLPEAPPWVLESEMRRLREKLARDKIKLDPNAGLYTLRHTFLTEAGEHTGAFRLQYIAGHDTIKTTMRYVHLRRSL